MQKQLLTSYMADVGTCVINGIGINNHIGDGRYDVYYTDEPTEDIKSKIIKDVWIDLRNGFGVTIHSYDCAQKNDPDFPTRYFAEEMFGDSSALQIAVDDGDIYLVRYF